MITLPVIEGIKWVSKDLPDIVGVGITLVNKQDLEMNLKNIETTDCIQYFDMSKLSGVRHFYAEEADVPSEDECLIDVEGMASTAAKVTLVNMMKAWLFYKTYKNDTRNL